MLSLGKRVVQNDRREYLLRTGIDRRAESRLAASRARSGEVRSIYEDHGISGAASERPGLADALARAGEGDVLVVWKLDRPGPKQ